MVERPRARSGPDGVRESRRALRGRIGTVVVCAVAGLMITVSASAARGYDLRGDRASDLRELAEAQHQHAAELRPRAERLRAEVERLSAQESLGDDLHAQVDAAALAASVPPVQGPALRVTLNDAPAEVKPAGIDDDALVVHQQDIQAVVNALWAGGAEAMSVQGQRIIATTGIKCVGNTIMLQGVPYAPPYVIVAIGDQDALEKALDESSAVRIYRQYVAAYALGYSQERLEKTGLPGFTAPLGIGYAQVLE